MGTSLIGAQLIIRGGLTLTPGGQAWAVLGVGITWGYNFGEHTATGIGGERLQKGAPV